jgi:hypothetical protein
LRERPFTGSLSFFFLHLSVLADLGRLVLLDFDGWMYGARCSRALSKEV